MENESDTIIISSEEAGERLDKVLAKRFEDRYSRTYFQYLIEEKLITVNGIPIKKRMSFQEGDQVEINFALTPQMDLVPENIPLDILYEDQDLIVINKPAGMVVHPAVGNWSGTFVNALLHHCKLDIPNDNTVRPGIVHRLDKETSGVLIAAKNTLAQQRLITLFSSRNIDKEYLAICLGNPGEGEIRAPIGRHPVNRKLMAIVESGGKEAVTRFKTLASDGKLSLVKVKPETGRTHQIRVHMKLRGSPVLGDSQYGNIQANKKFDAKRLMLHAYRLQFKHPMNNTPLEFLAEPPEDFRYFAERIKKCAPSSKE
jgi:23S rRNA pseudouridine1911/1915/1917 synthase